MKSVERVLLSDEEHEIYKKLCKQQGRSMREQASQLIRAFILKNSKK